MLYSSNILINSRDVIGSEGRLSTEWVGGMGQNMRPSLQGRDQRTSCLVLHAVIEKGLRL